MLIVSGTTGWAPSNLSYKTPGFFIAFTFMYFIKKRYLAWWEKYNYVMAASLIGGCEYRNNVFSVSSSTNSIELAAFSAIILFFAVQYSPKPLVWWGNTVSGSGVDGMGIATIFPIPAGGYFGPEKGHFP